MRSRVLRNVLRRPVASAACTVAGPGGNVRTTELFAPDPEAISGSSLCPKAKSRAAAGVTDGDASELRAVDPASGRDSGRGPLPCQKNDARGKHHHRRRAPAAWARRRGDRLLARQVRPRDAAPSLSGLAAAASPRRSRPETDRPPVPEGVVARRRATSRPSARTPPRAAGRTPAGGRGRPAGSFGRARAKTASRPVEGPLARSSRGAGPAAHVLVHQRKRALPVERRPYRELSYATTASEYRSVAGVAGLPCACSGAM